MHQLADGSVRVYSGNQMRLRFFVILGLRRSVAIASLLNAANVPVFDIRAKRRQFLKLSLGVAVSLGLPKVALAKVAGRIDQPGLPDDLLKREGVVGYSVDKHHSNSAQISFTHSDADKSGEIRVVHDSSQTQVQLFRKGSLIMSFVRIFRGSETQTAEGDELRFQHSNGKEAALMASAKGWEPSGSTDQGFLEENEADLRLMAALHAVVVQLPSLQTAVANPSSRDSLQRDPQTNACPCVGPWVRSDAFYGSARSIACMAATNNLHAYKCSDPWCWGCCNLWFDCDCVCAVGDYLCTCARSGQGCGAPCT